MSVPSPARFLLVHCILPITLCLAQDETTPAAQSRPRFYHILWAGAKASLGSRDLGLLAASLLVERQQKWAGVQLPPLELDQSVSAELAAGIGQRSFGSISPKYYPRYTGTYRLFGMTLLDALGVTHFSAATYEKLFRFHLAILYNTSWTHLTKRNLSRLRPDGSDNQSFISGHTSTAFATSTYLYLETNDLINSLESRNQLPLFSKEAWKAASITALYGWAAYVGYSRIRDRKHYLTDVLVGAVSGSLISYLVYPRQTGGITSSRSRIGLLPQADGAMLAFHVAF